MAIADRTSALAPGTSSDAEDLTFADVVGELHRIAALAESGPDAGPQMVAACRRAESLLTHLRNQFMGEVLAMPGGLRSAS